MSFLSVYVLLYIGMMVDTNCRSMLTSIENPISHMWQSRIEYKDYAKLHFQENGGVKFVMK